MPGEVDDRVKQCLRYAEEECTRTQTKVFKNIGSLIESMVKEAADACKTAPLIKFAELRRDADKLDRSALLEILEQQPEITLYSAMKSLLSAYTLCEELLKCRSQLHVQYAAFTRKWENNEDVQKATGTLFEADALKASGTMLAD